MSTRTAKSTRRPYELTDEEWAEIEHLLPRKKAPRGWPRIDNRLVIEAFVVGAVGLCWIYCWNNNYDN